MSIGTDNQIWYGITCGERSQTRPILRERGPSALKILGPVLDARTVCLTATEFGVYGRRACF